MNRPLIKSCKVLEDAGFVIPLDGNSTASQKGSCSTTLITGRE